MGSCLGHCHHHVSRMCIWSSGEGHKGLRSEPDDNLDVYETKGNYDCLCTGVRNGYQRLSGFLSRIRSKKDSSLRLELLDDAWCSSDNESTFPIPQISPTRKVNFRRSPANSMELEWEHLPEMVQERRQAHSLREHGEEPVSATSPSAWSRGSSRDSLEWDPNGDQMNGDEDETEELLEEIERLNCKTLQETLGWTS